MFFQAKICDIAKHFSFPVDLHLQLFAWQLLDLLFFFACYFLENVVKIDRHVRKIRRSNWNTIPIGQKHTVLKITKYVQKKFNYKNEHVKNMQFHLEKRKYTSIEKAQIRMIGVNSKKFHQIVEKVVLRRKSWDSERLNWI